MVARGALGYPWIFSEARALLSGKDLPQAPSKHARLALLREHAYAVVRWYGDDSLIRMRKHAGLYVSGLAAAGQFRRRLHEIHTLQELDALLEEYEA
jgi:tRNA-dihydrouridine synthase